MARLIELTRGRTAIIDDDDYRLVAGFSWQAVQSSSGVWYARTGIYVKRKKTDLLMHRLILPGHPAIDHADGDGLNNRRGNLRPATNSQNQANRKKSSGCTSQYKGVSWFARKRKWHARIIVNYARKHLGYFKSETEAALAYDRAALAIYGEFARLNFPQS